MKLLVLGATGPTGRLVVERVRADHLFTRAGDAVVRAPRQTYAAANAMQKFMDRTLLRNIYADKSIAEQEIRASSLEWTFVYPTALTHGRARGEYRVDDRVEMKFAARITPADVADFMHEAAHTPEWIRREAVITD